MQIAAVFEGLNSGVLTLRCDVRRRCAALAENAVQDICSNALSVGHTELSLVWLHDARRHIGLWAEDHGIESVEIEFFTACSCKYTLLHCATLVCSL